MWQEVFLNRLSLGSNLEVTKSVFTGLFVIGLEFDIIESVVPVVKCFTRRCFAGLKCSTRFRLVIYIRNCYLFLVIIYCVLFRNRKVGYCLIGF